MRQNYFKNAALLTGSDVVLRLAGMGLRIWLANALGGAGMGLYQLVLAVYGLFVTLATAGISVAGAGKSFDNNDEKRRKISAFFLLYKSFSSVYNQPVVNQKQGCYQK